jgi:hypothetical protein
LSPVPETSACARLFAPPPNLLLCFGGKITPSSNDQFDRRHQVYHVLLLGWRDAMTIPTPRNPAEGLLFSPWNSRLRRAGILPVHSQHGERRRSAGRAWRHRQSRGRPFLGERIRVISNRRGRRKGSWLSMSKSTPSFAPTVTACPPSHIATPELTLSICGRVMPPNHLYECAAAVILQSTADSLATPLGSFLDAQSTRPKVIRWWPAWLRAIRPRSRHQRSRRSSARRGRHPEHQDW